MLRKRKNANKQNEEDNNSSIDNPTNKNEKNTVKSSHSTGMQKSLEKAQSINKSWQKPDEESGPIKESYVHEEIPIGQIVRDDANSRTRHILPGNPTKNALDKDHPDFDENQKVIDGLIEFSEQLKVSPIQTSIGVYPYRGKHKILFGNRRYFAMKIAYGDRYRMPCKVYNSKPKNPNAARFIENSSREDLSLISKLIDFENAYKEIKGDKGNEHNLLGISKTGFYRLLKIISTKDVYQACLDNKILKIRDAENLAIKVKTENERTNVIPFLAKGLSLDEAIKASKLENEKIADKPKASRGREKTSIKVPLIKGKEKASKAIQSIINGGLKEMNWDDLDWEDLHAIQARLDENIEALLKEI